MTNPQKQLQDKAINLVDISKLDFDFQDPPLLVSGVAMMYHGLRESEKDIDMILSRRDHRNLVDKLLPTAEILEEDHKSGYKETPQFSDLWGDHGILTYEFELWDTIMQFGYDDLNENAIEEIDYVVISLEKLLLLSMVRGVSNERYQEDAKLIAKTIADEQYKGFVHNKNDYWVQ